MPSTKKRPVLALTMSSSLALRNFFLTDILDELLREFDIVALAAPPTARAMAQLGVDAKVRVVAVEVGPEPLSWKLLRQLKKKVHLEGRSSATEAIWEKYQPRPPYQRLGGWMVKRLIAVMSAERLYHSIDVVDLAMNRDHQHVALLRELGVDYFFATHATSRWEESLLRSAMAASLPRLYMVLSWDHLSSKVLLHENFDRVYVWNDHTRHELLSTYPAYRPEQVEVVGIPQYDAFLEPPSHTYESWCALYGLDPTRKTILFSTMPQIRHNQQHIIIEDLLKAIIEGRDVPSDYQVLIKCHPFDNFEGYRELLGKYPVGLRPSGLDPRQGHEEWIPGEHEIEDSRDCLYFCAININIFSTVTIEAAWFDKPVIHIAYDPLPIPPGRIPCHEYYNWEHFKHVVEKDASIMVRSRDELFAAIRKYSTDPSFKSDGRRRVVAEYIGDGIGRSAHMLATAVARYARRGG